LPIVKIKPSKKKNAVQIEQYIKNPNKTSPDLYFDNLCIAHDDVSKQFQEFNTAMNKYESAYSRSYYHLIISFNTQEGADKITPQECKEITKDILSCIPGLDDYLYFGTVHFDTNHIHSHVIINNCNIYGYSFQCKKSYLRKMKEIANVICQERGLIHSITQIDRPAKATLSDPEAQMLLKRNEVPWKETLRFQIEDCMRRAGTLREFEDMLEQRYHVKAIQWKKGYRYLMEGQTKPCPERRLGEQYTKDYIQKVLSQKKIRKELRERSQIQIPH